MPRTSGTIEFCPDCRCGAAFPKGSDPKFIVPVEPSFARGVIARATTGIFKPEVEIRDQTDTVRLTIRVPEAALDVQGSIRDAFAECKDKRSKTAPPSTSIGKWFESRTCGAEKILNERFNARGGS